MGVAAVAAARVVVVAGALALSGLGAVSGAAEAVPRSPAAPAAATAPSSPAARTSPRLIRFQSCAGLTSYARRAAKAHLSSIAFADPNRRNPPLAFTGGAPSSAPTAAAGTTTKTAGTDYSTTNVQEQGVDEPDTVKTDGTYLYAVQGSRLHVFTVAGGVPTHVAEVSVRGRSSTTYDYGQEILLRGNRVIYLATRSGISAREAGTGTGRAKASDHSFRTSAVMAEIDVTDPTNPRVVRSLTVDGTYVSARAVDGTARVVISSTPEPIYLPFAADGAEPTATAKRAAIGRTQLRHWRPQMAINRSNGTRALRGAVPCGDIAHPSAYSGLDSTTVLTFNLDHGLEQTDSDAILGSTDTVYASTQGLVLATVRYDERYASTGQVDTTISTVLHRFDTSTAGQTTYTASGRVPGYLLSSYALSDKDGYLRVTSSQDPPWFGDGTTKSTSTLTVLQEQDGLLVPVGKVTGLGVGQRVYAVRYAGDVAYVVTFRQIDPLYVIDLSHPNAPKVVGKLELTGYSAYLHPIDGGRLIGVGADATEQGRRDGTQVSQFDVSDPAHPTLVGKAKVGDGSYTGVEYDTHAFLWWAPTRTVVLPVTLYGSNGTEFNGVYAYNVTAAGAVNPIGRVQDPKTDANDYSPGIQRTVVIDGRLVTISARGVGVATLDTMSRTGFAPFPKDPYDNVYGPVY